MGHTFRTSQTDPLRIAEVTVGSCSGLIGITLCPGKCSDSLYGPAWKRDLDEDLDAIRRWGAKAVVTLVEDHELKSLQVEQIGVKVRERDMQWYHLPIVDVQPPGIGFEKVWAQSGPALCNLLVEGGRLLVHCRGGLGRAGTVAALLLTAAGETPRSAIRRVRDARLGAIETPAQEAYVLAWRPSLTYVMKD